MAKYLTMLMLLVSTFSQAENLPSHIKLATTNWCPYACENSKEYPGIIHDYISKLLNQKGIEVSIQFYPWSRAIKMANRGKVDGLLTAVQAEAPGLIFTNVPTDTYQMCFFTRADSEWVFKDATSLNQIRLGVIDSYGYGNPVDDFLKSSPKNVDSVSSGGISTLHNMLQSKRFDAFIDDPKVIRWTLKEDFKYIRLAGCLKKNPFYLAINPKKTWANDFVSWLDFQLKASRFVLSNIQDAYY